MIDPADEIYFAAQHLDEAVQLFRADNPSKARMRVQSALELLGEKDTKALEKYGVKIREPYERLRQLGYKLL